MSSGGPIQNSMSPVTFPKKLPNAPNQLGGASAGGMFQSNDMNNSQQQQQQNQQQQQQQGGMMGNSPANSNPVLRGQLEQNMHNQQQQQQPKQPGLNGPQQQQQQQQRLGMPATSQSQGGVLQQQPPQSQMNPVGGMINTSSPSQSGNGAPSLLLSQLNQPPNEPNPRNVQQIMDLAGKVPNETLSQSSKINLNATNNSSGGASASSSNAGTNMSGNAMGAAGTNVGPNNTGNNSGMNNDLATEIKQEPISSSGELINKEDIKQENIIKQEPADVEMADVKPTIKTEPNIKQEMKKETPDATTTKESASPSSSGASASKALVPVGGKAVEVGGTTTKDAKGKSVVTFSKDELKKALEPTLVKMYNMEPEGVPFREPVDPEALCIPDYLEVIKKPMDMKQIKIKLDTGEYKDPWEFVDDVWLMFENAWIYNKKNSRVYKFCTKVCID